LTTPFTQLLPLANLPVRGKLSDDQLQFIPNAGILTEDGKIIATGNFNDLLQETSGKGVAVHEIEGDAVCLPGFVDCHTHLLFAGSRAMDYAARNAGKTYQEIGAAGGGIKDTMAKTRAASDEKLTRSLKDRLDRHLRNGVTTVEVKSGYGLSVDQELRMLRIIKKTGDAHAADVISTCLAAHVIPPEIGEEREWLRVVLEGIVPVVEAEQLASRFDIFVEGGAFTAEHGRPFLERLKSRASLAIASDWNPGSAPMGDLLTQAAILGTFEKLATAEVLAGLTFRAAAALGLNDRGRLKPGQRADFITFPTADYREILYQQGQLKPNRTWKNGLPIT